MSENITRKEFYKAKEETFKEIENSRHSLRNEIQKRIDPLDDKMDSIKDSINEMEKNSAVRYEKNKEYEKKLFEIKDLIEKIFIENNKKVDKKYLNQVIGVACTVAGGIGIVLGIYYNDIKVLTKAVVEIQTKIEIIETIN